MSDETVYEIDLSKKYIIVIERKLSMEESARLKANYRKWVESDEPILFLFGEKVRLLKVEEAEDE